MSLLALLVGIFLIFSAVSFAVVQRRRVIGVLRALGATRSRVLTMILTEALMLGIVGAGLGLVLGVFIGRELVALVSRTINDLYFVVAVNNVVIPGLAVAKAVGAGIDVALFMRPPCRRSKWPTARRHWACADRLSSSVQYVHPAGCSVPVSCSRRLRGLIVLCSRRGACSPASSRYLLLAAHGRRNAPAVLRGLALAASRIAGRFRSDCAPCRGRHRHIAESRGRRDCGAGSRLLPQ